MPKLKLHAPVSGDLKAARKPSWFSLQGESSMCGFVALLGTSSYFCKLRDKDLEFKFPYYGLGVWV